MDEKFMHKHQGLQATENGIQTSFCLTADPVLLTMDCTNYNKSWGLAAVWGIKTGVGDRVEIHHSDPAYFYMEFMSKQLFSS